MANAPVILVHGFMNAGFVFYKMKRFLETQGLECHAPSLKPVDAGNGVESWSEQLQQFIREKYGPEQDISLVGFSMGGIVARYYAQHLEKHERIRNLVTIATPHQGTRMAYLYPRKGTKQIRPDSLFLSELKENDIRLNKINLHAFWSPLDGIIRPSENAQWSVAENHSYRVPMHLLMIFNKPLLHDLVIILKSSSS